MPIIQGVGVVVEDHGRVLLGRRASGPFRDQWCLPGGKIEPGEAIEECVRRELLEETGLKARGPLTMISVSSEIDQEHDFHSFTFGAMVTAEGKLFNPEPHKFAEWRWVPLNDLPEKLFRPTISVLQAYFDWKELNLPRLPLDDKRPGEFVRLFRRSDGE